MAWKERTPTLRDDARQPGIYQSRGGPIGPLPICLPSRHASLNLLPDIRDQALTAFEADGIVWHDGVATGPSNHLLDSQVQCANALTPGATNPDFIKQAFAASLPIAEVLPVETNRFLTFEYIGASDYLREREGLPRTRGSMTTSADAAIRYRTPRGEIEIALLEWKFTEDYRGHELKPPRGIPRADRYRALWDSPNCPIRHDLIPYEDLFVEPFYQLFRQQLLAWSMEQARELDATRVTVLHLCPRANGGVRSALNRESHRSAGSDVMKIWSEMCRSPDRFISVDTASFIDHRSEDYRGRYQFTP